MFTPGVLLILLLAQASRFEVDGRILPPGNHAFRSVEIESIDHRFVEYRDVDRDGKFVIKKVPEGLYKLIMAGPGGREERRTVEVRAVLADSHGRVEVDISIEEHTIPSDHYKVGAGALGVSPKAVSELQKAYEARGDIAKVKEHLQRAIAISPNFEEALNNLGTLYFRDRQFGQAREFFERALRANPNSFAAQVNLGGAWLALHNDERALAANLRAVEMRPAESLGQSQLGQSLLNLKRYDEALEHLKIAKRIDPMSFTLPGLFIARIYEIRRESADALAEYKEFLNAHPGNSYSEFVRRRVAILEKPQPLE